MPLRLTLKPHERIILGGAVVRNGETHASLLIENQVPVLRENDILSPRTVCTPCERVYLALQLLYVDPERRADHLETYRKLAEAVAIAAPSCQPILERNAEHEAAGFYYRAHKAGHVLRRHERELFQHVS